MTFKCDLCNIGASPKTIIYDPGQLLPESFLQFFIDENQSLFGKVLSTALVLMHVVNLLS